MWKHYFQNTQGIIFVIDSNDTERIPLVKEEIHRTLSDEELYNVPVLFLANKADLPNSMLKNALIKHLDLNKIRDRTFYVQYTNGLTGEGIYDGIKWLTAIIKSK